MAWSSVDLSGNNINSHENLAINKNRNNNNNDNKSSYDDSNYNHDNLHVLTGVFYQKQIKFLLSVKDQLIFLNFVRDFVQVVTLDPMKSDKNCHHV